MNRFPFLSLPASISVHALVLAAIALIAGVLALQASTALAQDAASCEANDLGALSAEAATIEVEGRWTTEDCESRFRAGSDAHTYLIELSEPGRVRVDLTSDEGDSYLYLMAEDGSRIAEDDDGNNILNSRIERELAAGVYLIEATTVGGRGQGAADFVLTIDLLTECGPTHLGTLAADADLTASGSWGLETCASQFLKDHPALVFTFTMAEGGLVQIDLTSPTGDPVLAVTAEDGVVVDANDDGGGFRNSRVLRYLRPGLYLVETTTYRERGLQPLSSDFVLTIHLVDEEAQQNTFNIKIETAHIPDQVIAGEPFTLHYRAGNLGGGDLADAGGYAVLYAVAPRTSDRTGPIFGSEERLQAGASYHSGSQTATETSIAIDEVTPFSLTLNNHGSSWVFVASIVFDEEDEEIGFHGIWKDLEVLSGPTYGPHAVSVDGTAYSVTAADDDEGLVTTSVTSVADPTAEVDNALVQAKATYAAGVGEFVLNGLFERPGLAALTPAGDPLEVSLANASSSSLLKIFGEEYAATIGGSSLVETFAAGEAINPVVVEDLILQVADKAARQYASLSASWSTLQERVAGGEALSFADAFALQTELAYAERILAPVVAAGAEIRAVRGGSMTDDTFPLLVAGLTGSGACHGSALLGNALRLAGVEEVDALLALDAELRNSLGIFAEGADAALCGALSVDRENSAFLGRLGIVSEELAALNAPELAPQPEAEPAPAAPHRLRVTALLAADGRVEHVVELASGEQIRPTQRFLPADADPDRWYVTTDVEVDGTAIGHIRARRLTDNRIEVGFRDAYGVAISPEILFLPADLPLGRWVNTGEIEVPPAPAPVVEEEAPESE